ncbi:uncharacterized protein LOC111624925 isoform X2 [Centruroides sculpturatus]|nr:uncharacterized protein LOC111624925 isoform X2 [Centruroides sculpturatus]
MSEVKRLVISFVQFLGDQLQHGSLSSDAKESLEVAIQCLQSAYGICPNSADEVNKSQSLLQIFSDATRETVITVRNPKRESCSECDPATGGKKPAADCDYMQNHLNGFSEKEGIDCPSVCADHTTEQLQLTRGRRQCAGRNELSAEDSVLGSRSGMEAHRIGCNGMHGETRPLDLSLETSKHLLERLSPKGGCVQCGKDGRLTKRGRPHESYFGCKLCRVHLCRKRNCFDIWHTVS